jgi:hypothetical protein
VDRPPENVVNTTFCPAQLPASRCKYNQMCIDALLQRGENRSGDRVIPGGNNAMVAGWAMESGAVRPREAKDLALHQRKPPERG